jgi:hypothetical protein
MSAVWVPVLQRWLQDHAGIMPIAELVRAGCTRRDAYRLASSPDFEIIMPGVLRSTHWPLGETQLMIAACARNPHAVVGLATAARHWNFRGMPSDDGVHIMVPHGCSPALPNVTVHRCRQIDPVDIVKQRDGLRFTNPSRTMFDCADLFGPKRTESILEQLMNDGRGTFATHAATASRLSSARRPGSRTMCAVIASRPPWRAALQSELELLVLREIERQGLPRPEAQHRFILPNGDRIRLDFAWLRPKVALEVDHPYWHAGVESSHRDKRRDLKMATIGWQTVRVTDLDVHGGLISAINDVARVLALR